jgi:glutamate racemase
MNLIEQKQSTSILVIDSGLGGISILNALQKKIPNETYIYFADYAFLPYGEKSGELIEKRCFEIVNSFPVDSIKSVVLACNSATASAIGALRKAFPIEFFGTEPGIKPAALQSKSGIAVLATALTLRSEQFKFLIKEYANNSPVYAQAAPEWVDLVESGDWNSEQAKKIIKDVLVKIEKPFDTLLLGCTHFSFLKDSLIEILDENVSILDTSEAIASRVQDKLNNTDLLLAIKNSVDDRTRINVFYTKNNNQDLDINLSLLQKSLNKEFNVISTLEHS